MSFFFCRKCRVFVTFVWASFNTLKPLDSISYKYKNIFIYQNVSKVGSINDARLLKTQNSNALLIYNIVNYLQYDTHILVRTFCELTKKTNKDLGSS